eukprot:3660757-Pyramimonas_sp.AAC.1
MKEWVGMAMETFGADCERWPKTGRGHGPLRSRVGRRWSRRSRLATKEALIAERLPQQLDDANVERRC